MADAVQESRIHRRAEFGKFQQFGRIFGVMGGKHPGGCTGGSRHGAVLFQHQDGSTAAAQFKGKRKANNASPKDADIHFMGDASI